MLNHSDRPEAKRLLIDLKRGYDWCMKHESEKDLYSKPAYQPFFERAEEKMKRLEQLGIEDGYMYFYLGGSISHYNLEAFLDQYEEMPI